MGGCARQGTPTALQRLQIALAFDIDSLFEILNATIVSAWKLLASLRVRPTSCSTLMLGVLSSTISRLSSAQISVQLRRKVVSQRDREHHAHQ